MIFNFKENFVCVPTPFESCNDCFDRQLNICCLADLILCLKTVCEITILRQKILIFFYILCFFLLLCVMLIIMYLRVKWPPGRGGGTLSYDMGKFVDTRQCNVHCVIHSAHTMRVRYLRTYYYTASLVTCLPAFPPPQKRGHWQSIKRRLVSWCSMKYRRDIS